ncbi:MAG: sulfur oxidation c-type cytochrome SoxX, partial [Thioalkalispiraceae bacterium]
MHRAVTLVLLLICAGLLPLAYAENEAHQHHHGGGGGHHGMVVPESKHFPTLAYDDKRVQKSPQKKPPETLKGDPQHGKHLAYSAKGRCLSCHVLGADGQQPGTVGPNLSTYGTRGIDPAMTFQQIWDARLANPNSIMPAFGTFDLLKENEIADITAYLHTLKRPVAAPAALTNDTRGVWVAGEDLTRADVYLEQGERLFRKPGANNKSCATCHANGGSGPSLEHAAATYPKWQAHRKRIVLLEQQINMCRMHRMDSKHFPLGSQESNLLLSYVKYLARHEAVKVATDGPAAQAIARGKQSFYRRTGQLNF